VKILAILFSLSLAAAAQDSPVVRATTRVLADGSRATTITDREAQTATETVTTASGKVIRKKLFTLDAEGVSTGVIHYNEKGVVVYKEAYKRDFSGQIAASYLYSPADKLLGHRTFLYGSKGEVIQIDDYDASGKLIPKAAPASGKKKR